MSQEILVCSVLFLALVGALGTLSLLRYDLAIALPEKDEEGVQVLGLCLGVLLVFTVSFGFGVWLFRDKISELLNNPAFSDCAWMVSLGIFGWGVFQAMSAWASRRGYFKTFELHCIPIARSELLAQVCLRVVGHTWTVTGKLNRSGSSMFFRAIEYARERMMPPYYQL